MSERHSQGPIYFRADGEANTYTLIDRTTNRWRMTILLNGEQVTARQVADLERMAACWNACEGISTDTLERGPDSVFIYAGDLTKQRDELLQVLLMVKEAAIAMRGADFNLTTEQWETFHSVIAKATGSKA